MKNELFVLYIYRAAQLWTLAENWLNLLQFVVNGGEVVAVELNECVTANL